MRCRCARFELIDGVTSGLFERLLGQHVPGLGILTAIVLLVVIGALARKSAAVLATAQASVESPAASSAAGLVSPGAGERCLTIA